MNRTTLKLGLLVVTIGSLQACATVWSPARDAEAGKQGYDNPNVTETITAFTKQDPGLTAYFEEAYGYAIFPTVAKAAFGVGGAHGTGSVFQQKQYIGETTLTQFTIGLQLGGQAYRQVIFFRDETSLKRFTSGRWELGAQASAVAVTAGASANASYENSVAIFTMTKGGLMYEASVGGQTFVFEPKE